MNIVLKNLNGMRLTLSSIGATWLSCELPLGENTTRQVLLTCFDPCNNSEAFIGSTIGRYSNRIKNAVIKHNDIEHIVTANQGTHQLHGGKEGFHTKNWQVISQQSNRVIFALVSMDGEQGFPGQVEVTVDFLLTNDNEVVINYIASPHDLTPINLTNHAYFNLDGEGDILKHELSVDADYYLPVDKEGIPDSDLSLVENGDMDLRQLQLVGQHLLRSPDRKLLNGYDHAYLLNQQSRKLERPAAKLVSSDKKIIMEVLTNKPAIQVYTGNNLYGVKGAKQNYQNYSGIALETEFLPDSPNRSDWPHESCWFSEGQFYCYTTVYRFIF